MALTPKQDRINRALDEPLTGADLAAFQAFLESEQEEATLYEQLREVDDLLRRPPLAAPSPDFTTKVMARIEAGEHAVYAPHRRARRLLLWGGFISTLLVPLVVVLAVVIPALTMPDVFISVLQGVVQGLSTVTSLIGGVLTFLANLIAQYPMAPALSLTVIPLIMVWAWLVWFLQQRNRPATIIIPVQAAGSSS
jgi:hypothetical protein